MSWFSKDRIEEKFNWRVMNDISQLNEIIDESFEHPVMIFKHSTRCSVSTMAKRRLETGWEMEDSTLTPYYLDLLKFRDVSNKIESEFRIRHESPQILLIKDGKCTYSASHGHIEVRSLKKEL